MSNTHLNITHSCTLGLLLILGATLTTVGCESPEHVGNDESESNLSPPGVEVFRQTKIHDGEPLTLIKYIDDDANITGVIVDARGEEIDPALIQHVSPDLIHPHLRGVIDRSPHHAEVEVVLGFADPAISGRSERTERGYVTIDESGHDRVELDGVHVTAQELAYSDRERSRRIDESVAASAGARREQLRELGRRKPGFTDHPSWRLALERGDASVIVPLRVEEIEEFAEQNADLVVGIELPEIAVDDIGGAMSDTAIDPWALGYPARHGLGVGIYMSESGCPNPGHIGSYMRLSGVSEAHNMNVSAILRSVSPASYVYCRSGPVLPSGADLAGYNGNPRVYIESHSWSYSNTDNANFTLADRDFDNHVYETLVSVFKSVGNYGANNGYVSSPGKALNVTSVGNYDDATDIINAASSFRDSEIGNKKPELSAPGTSVCAGGICMTGTSQAAPHAAGFAADLLGAYAWLRLRPTSLAAFMLAAADKPITGGVDKVGVGGLNFRRAYYEGSVWWYDGPNGAFNTHDAADPSPNNAAIDVLVPIDAAKTNVRVAIDWLTRGTFTYDHRADLHPLGLDLDLCVLNPQGVTVACSASWDQPFELISFDPTISGTYRIRITRFSNADVSAKFTMSLAVDSI
jgi:hypothetical protein